MTKGVVLFASNNGVTNYIKQAKFCADRIKQYLNLPVTLITNQDIEKKYDYWMNRFDKVIRMPKLMQNQNQKRYFDGDLSNKILLFNNGSRAWAYKLSPYDETIVMDTDYILSNDSFLQCFEGASDFSIYNNATHIGIHDGTTEFQRISDTSIDFYWATIFFFRRTPLNKIFFDLIKHIEENYMHYRNVYQFSTPLFRNDFAFSIAIHIMNGYQTGEFANKMPGKKYYSIDKDICLEINNGNIKLLTQKENRLGEYTAVNISDCNLHIMNKFSLERCIDNQ